MVYDTSKYVILSFAVLLFIMMLLCPLDTGFESNKYQKPESRERAIEHGVSANN